MASVFSIFFLELIAFRWGSAKLASIGLQGHGTLVPTLLAFAKNARNL